MILFKVNTHYQFLTALNIKCSMFPDSEADLYLGDTTDFSNIIKKIRRQKIFRKVFYLDELKLTRQYLSSSAAAKLEMLKNINLYFNVDNVEYSDIFLGLDNVHSKLFYYCLVQNGQMPKVHIFEEGTTSFVRNTERALKGDGINHESYGNKQFFKNIVELLSYCPELYSVKTDFPLNRIPKFGKYCQKVTLKLYKAEEIPQEKYIFFEEAMIAEQYPTNDIELIEIISGIVGKENIIVKRHPRSIEDRFSCLGYKVMNVSNIPWEVNIINKLETDVLSDKVSISVFSTASYTGCHMFGIPQQSIHLCNMMLGKYPLLEHVAFKDFKDKFYDIYNNESNAFFCPSTLYELKETFKYLKGREYV